MADTDAPPAPTPFAAGVKIAARYAAAAAAAATIEAGLAAQIAPLKAAADKKLEPIAAKLAKAEGDAKAWWTIHGAAVRGKKKSAELAGCVLGTRLSPAKVIFAHGDDKAGAAQLVGRRMITLLKRVVTLDKTAIAKRIEEEAKLDEADRVLAPLGFSIEQSETFYIEPATRTGRKS